MDSELGQAFYNVYTSTKKILKNENQRYLFCNTIDLLSNTCKTAGINCDNISKEDIVQFWLADMLPFMFDKDIDVQNSCIASLDLALTLLNKSDIQNSTYWPEFKTKAIKEYGPKINALLNTKNSNWFKMWCIIIQLLDHEILRGAIVINSFLSIVERGFRDPDISLRLQAFHCWRILIKIFATYNELNSPKRLKLICIPLKSTQPKTTQLAEIKFRVWWYLLSSMGDHLATHFDNVAVPFLAFAFGPVTRSPSGNQQYRPFLDLSLPVLALLMSISHNEQVQDILRDKQLEAFNGPSPLMKRDVLKQHWPSLLNAVISGIKLVSRNDSANEFVQKSLYCILHSLAEVMITMQLAPLTIQACDELKKIRPIRVVTLFNIIATENLSINQNFNDIEDFKKILIAFMNLCIKAKSELPPSILQRCINLIFAIETLQAETPRNFQLLSSLLEIVVKSNDEDDYDAFEVKLLIWRRLSLVIINYLRVKNFDCKIKQNITLFHHWILWPLQTCVGFANRHSRLIFDNNFCDIWRQLVNSVSNLADRKKFLINIKNCLSELLKDRREEIIFSELFDIYVTAVLKQYNNKYTLLQTDVFNLFNEIFTTEDLSQKTIEGCLNTLRNTIIGLQNNDITTVFDGLKSILAAALKCWVKNKYEGNFLNEWKRAINDKIRSHPTKSITNQIKELLKDNDVYVIIPSVWSLNPEKLTDRQKERFAEKAFISALYNDMSQSQDSSLQPWTPKKIVIAKNNQTEIAIESVKKDNVKEVNSAMENMLGSEIPTPGVQRTSNSRKSTHKERETELDSIGSAIRTTNEQKSTEKYNFRKNRSKVDQSEELFKRQLSLDENLMARITRNRCYLKDVYGKTETKIISNKNTKSPAQKTPQSSSKASKEKNSSICHVTLTAEEEQALKETAAVSVDLFPASTETANIEINAETVTEKDTQLNTQTEMGAPVEVSTPTKDKSKLTERSAIEAVQLLEQSPKKNSARFTALSSPPDRRFTNNNTSPTLRPKPSAHLTGRGAQLINMIRNKKLDATSPYQITNSMAKPSTQATPARILERIEASTPIIEFMDLTSAEQTSTPMQSNDLLVFSKRLPSPSASPSVSILKRKMLCDSVDETGESPAFKRKRVSFHDPPVSVTKEYFRETDESKIKPKRCLQLDKVGNNSNISEIKQSLKRRSKLDSMLEIEKFSNDKLNKSNEEANTAAGEKTTDAIAEALIWKDSYNGSTNVTDNVITTEIDEPAMKTQNDGPIIDTDVSLNTVVEQCPIEQVLKKYVDGDSTVSIKNINMLAKFLSNQMTNNQKIKANVLEMLSENHSKDFLDHAVRENLSSVVCDRLNLNSVLEYICFKSRINNNCRVNLLAQIPDILKSNKVDSERMSFIDCLFKNCDFTDEQILNIISMLLNVRQSREKDINIVSESAVDSSSNL